MENLGTDPKYRLGCDDLNWTIQKLEHVGAGKSRWRHVKWYGDNLPLALTNLWGLLGRDRFDPEYGLRSVIDALDGAKWSICRLKAEELMAQARFLRPPDSRPPRGAAPKGGDIIQRWPSDHGMR